MAILSIHQRRLALGGDGGYMGSLMQLIRNLDVLSFDEIRGLTQSRAIGNDNWVPPCSLFGENNESEY